jgi:hypothetical protein
VNSDGVIRARYADGWTSEQLKDGSRVLELVSGVAPAATPVPSAEETVTAAAPAPKPALTIPAMQDNSADDSIPPVPMSPASMMQAAMASGALSLGEVRSPRKSTASSASLADPEPAVSTAAARLEHRLEHPTAQRAKRRPSSAPTRSPRKSDSSSSNEAQGSPTQMQVTSPPAAEVPSTAEVEAADELNLVEQLAAEDAREEAQALAQRRADESAAAAAEAARVRAEIQAEAEAKARAESAAAAAAAAAADNAAAATAALTPRTSSSSALEDLEEWLVVSEREAVCDDNYSKEGEDDPSDEQLAEHGWELHWSDEEQLPFYYSPSKAITRWDKPTRRELWQVAARLAAAAEAPSSPSSASGDASMARLADRVALEQRLERLSSFRAQQQLGQTETQEQYDAEEEPDEHQYSAAAAAVPARRPPARSSSRNRYAPTSAGGSSSDSSAQYRRDMSVEEVCAWLRGTELAGLEERFRAEEVDGEMVALYAGKTEHTLLKHDLGVSAGRARAVHSALCAFVSGDVVVRDEAAVAAAEAARVEAEAEARREVIRAAIQEATDDGEYHKLPSLVAQLEEEQQQTQPWHDPDFEGFE